MRSSLALAAVAVGIVGIALRCSSGANPTGAGDAAQLGIRAAAALAKTASAKRANPVMQEAPPLTPVAPADHDSLDALLRALYEGVSHPADAQPDWARLEPLFVAGAGLTPPTHGAEGTVRALSFDQFREAVLQGIAARREDGNPRGFFEREIGRETRAFGNLTQVLSAYEARFRAGDPDPFLRGVNFIQATRSGKRWAIVSIAWDTEGPDNPIPESLLPTRPPAPETGTTPSP